ncbi:MAG TPA: hypothetical protein VI875_04620 [Candidatus Norongarragalinales archaeon]|nr:hypothetical protein [Candidatus Norongarragalinales archaeon]
MIKHSGHSRAYTPSHIAKSLETELIARKLEQEEKKMKKSKARYLSEKESLSKYR